MCVGRNDIFISYYEKSESYTSITHINRDTFDRVGDLSVVCKRPTEEDRLTKALWIITSSSVRCAFEVDGYDFY